PTSYASHATDFSLSCIETHTTASTDPHRTDRIIGNVYMRCVLMTSYGMPMPKIRVKVASAIRLLILASENRTLPIQWTQSEKLIRLMRSVRCLCCVRCGHRYPSISQTNENNFLFCSQFSDRLSFRIIKPLFR
ncbi:hypothetical protein SFRURICE_005846, partial [Spodoptera frugiperda]